MIIKYKPLKNILNPLKMNPQDIKRLGLILVTQAEIDAIKLENEVYRLSGLMPKYNAKEFDQKIQFLKEVVAASNEKIERMVYNLNAECY